MRKMNPTIYVFNHDASMYGAQKSLLDILRLSKDTFNYVVFNPNNGPLITALQSERIVCYEKTTRRWVFGPNHISLKRFIKNPTCISSFLIYNPYFLAIKSLVCLPVRVYRLYKIAKKIPPVLIYTNTLTNVDGAVLAWLLNVPHVWHVRERLGQNKDLVSLLPEFLVSKLILQLSSKVVTNSMSLKSSLFQSQFSENVEVVYNGVDISLFKPATNMGLTKKSRSYKVVICGSIIERKDIKTFLKAAALIYEKRDDVQFYIVGQGTGEYFDSILEDVKNLKIADFVNFLGQKSRISELLPEMDVLVSTAIYEPFGKTIIEAMASGLPVIATKSGGPEEIVIDNETGFLVSVGDYEAIATKIIWLFDNPLHAKRIGDSARKRAEACFELNQSVKKVVCCMKEAISNSCSNET